MALINRISRLFRADIHAVLDQLEEPLDLLRESIREMAELAENDQRRLKLAIDKKEQKEKILSDLSESVSTIEEELDLCITQSEEKLAKALIKKRLESCKLAKHIASQICSLSTDIDRLHKESRHNMERLDSMRQKMNLLDNNHTRAHDHIFHASSNIAVSEDEVEVAYLKELERRKS